MVDIKCLACGKTVKIPEYIDSDNYDGQLVCDKCKSLLYIKLVASKVRKYKVVESKREGDVPVSIVYKQVESAKETEG